MISLLSSVITSPELYSIIKKWNYILMRKYRCSMVSNSCWYLRNKNFIHVNVSKVGIFSWLNETSLFFIIVFVFAIRFQYLRSFFCLFNFKKNMYRHFLKKWSENKKSKNAYQYDIVNTIVRCYCRNKNSIFNTSILPRHIKMFEKLRRDIGLNSLEFSSCLQ